MAQERQEWIKANYRKQDLKSGVHIYIDYETLKNSLENTDIKVGDQLEIKRYALRGGKVLIKFRVNSDNSKINFPYRNLDKHDKRNKEIKE